MLKNMELDTKSNFMGLIIPKLCLFLILAILDVGHLENGFKKCPPDFSRPGSWLILELDPVRVTKMKVSKLFQFFPGSAFKRASSLRLMLSPVFV